MGDWESFFTFIASVIAGTDHSTLEVTTEECLEELEDWEEAYEYDSSGCVEPSCGDTEDKQNWRDYPYSREYYRVSDEIVGEVYEYIKQLHPITRNVIIQELESEGLLLYHFLTTFLEGETFEEMCLGTGDNTSFENNTSYVTNISYVTNTSYEDNVTSDLLSDPFELSRGDDDDFLDDDFLSDRADRAIDDFLSEEMEDIYKGLTPLAKQIIYFLQLLNRRDSIKDKSKIWDNGVDGFVKFGGEEFIEKMRKEAEEKESGSADEPSGGNVDVNCGDGNGGNGNG